MKHFKISLVLILLLSIGCKEKAKYSNITMIDSKEMKTMLKNDEVQLVDVRTVKEFNENYIEGAHNIVYDDNFDKKLDTLNKDKPIIVYCRSGRRSAKCAKILQKQGFSKIYDLKGGITQWMKEGNTIKK
ncbi:rhodanese-like domain-containing protein [Flavobacterium sp. CS20]|jgi:rhodanese-related sulfurtransferase|uniref:rhodanese-like domain-containing protein n=1 Tax=Flavobacterium sp. CS20 TaxID=2775246 RepID=UPI001B3A3C21|nr:rhodanese-like domain-containing protein [Flavobacterium sp. CS20]QTY28019.1 rhodanese-like domain-containing protein [Flavobacterium sp. CS20]